MLHVLHGNSIPPGVSLVIEIMRIRRTNQYLSTGRQMTGSECQQTLRIRHVLDHVADMDHFEGFAEKGVRRGVLTHDIEAFGDEIFHQILDDVNTDTFQGALANKTVLPVR